MVDYIHDTMSDKSKKRCTAEAEGRIEFNDEPPSQYTFLQKFDTATEMKNSF